MTTTTAPDSVPSPATAEAMPQAYAAVSLALTFLLVGIGYGLPVWLYPNSHTMRGWLGPEILNLYLLTAWLGLAHFVYAYKGHVTALRAQPRRFAWYLLALVVAGGVLVLLRQTLGLRLFGALAWVYFIPHFIKAELHFTAHWSPTSQPPEAPPTRLVTLFPTVAFATFTWALFMPTNGWLRLAVVALGWLALNLPTLDPLGVLFSPELFTLWVALHLVMSDYFNWQKRQRL